MRAKAADGSKTGRFLAVLEAARGDMTSSEIAEKAGIPATTASKFAEKLVNRGQIEIVQWRISQSASANNRRVAAYRMVPQALQTAGRARRARGSGVRAPRAYHAGGLWMGIAPWGYA